MSPPIIGPGSSVTPTATGVTREAYRRRLADELGSLAVLTVSSTASTAVTPDAARQLLVTALAVDQAPESNFDGYYVYAADGAQAGETRRVLEGSFDGPIGSLLLDRPFSAPLASGSEVELTSPLGGGRYLAIKGLNECINEALARIWTVGRISVTGNGTYEYSLSAYPWITDSDQIRAIDDSLYFGSNRPVDRSPLPYRVVQNGASKTLVTSYKYSTADTFYVEVFVRGDRLVSDGTTWAYQTTPGLQNDSYQAAVPEDTVVAFAMVKALQAHRRVLLADARMDRQTRRELVAENERRTLTYARLAARIRREQFPQPVPEPQRGLAIAPAWGGWPN